MLTVDKLNNLSEIRSDQVSCRKELEAIIYEAMSRCPDLKQKHEEISGRLEFLNDQESDLVESIKSDVIEHGSSIKGFSLHAVYTSGKASWDAKALEGYATAHPEILQFKKIGGPSISIREIKEAKSED